MYSMQYNKAPLFGHRTMTFLSYFKNLANSSPYQSSFPEISPEVQSYINNFLYENNLQLIIINKFTITDHKDWYYKLEPPSQSDINFYLPLLILELSLYPKLFFEKIKLKKIILSNSIIFHSETFEQYRAALPDYELDSFSFVLSCKERNLKYIRKVIHHELFHYFYFMYKGKYENKDDLWEMFNPKGFEYSAISSVWSQNDLIGNDYQGNNSFVSEFSKMKLEEDKAEVFCFMMTSGNDIKDLMKREGVIGKCLYIKQLMEEFDKEGFNIQGSDNFWEKVIKYKKEVVDVYYI